MLSTVAWSHHTRWPPAPCHVADARHFVARRLTDEGLEDLVESAALVASELATNAVLHARSWFGVRLERREDRVVLEVLDESDTAPHLDDGDDLDTHGRGLHLVEALSREWGVWPQTGGGKSVWASFDAPPGPAC